MPEKYGFSPFDAPDSIAAIAIRPLFARIVASQRHYNVHYRGGIFRFRSWILLRGAVDGAARFGSESSRKTGKPSDQGAHAIFRSANGTN